MPRGILDVFNAAGEKKDQGGNYEEGNATEREIYCAYLANRGPDNLGTAGFLLRNQTGGL